MKTTKDVIYPCRIPRKLFEAVQRRAQERDLRASQIIRSALQAEGKSEKDFGSALFSALRVILEIKRDGGIDYTVIADNDVDFERGEKCIKAMLQADRDQK